MLEFTFFGYVIYVTDLVPVAIGIVIFAIFAILEWRACGTKELRRNKDNYGNKSRVKNESGQ